MRTVEKVPNCRDRPATQVTICNSKDEILVKKLSGYIYKDLITISKLLEEIQSLGYKMTNVNTGVGTGRGEGQGLCSHITTYIFQKE